MRSWRRTGTAVAVLALALGACADVSGTGLGVPSAQAATVATAASSSASAVETAGFTPTAPSLTSRPAPFTPAGTTAMAVTPQMFGMHPGSYSPGVPAGAYRLWGGAKVLWRDIEPVKGRWVWKPVDDRIASARAAGVKDIMFVFGGTPLWAARGTAPTDIWGPGSASVPKEWADFTAFVRAVMTRYKGKITSYQSWNEVNEESFWRGSAAETATVASIVRDARNAIDPRAKLISPSVTTRRPYAARKIPQILRELGKAGWPFDVFAVHVYPTAPGGPAQRRAQIADFRAKLKAVGAPASKPLWDTEINYGLPGMGFAPRSVPGATGAAWLARTYLDSLRMGVSRTYWYAWSPDRGYLGVRLWSGTVAAASFTVLRGWLVGTTFTGCSGTRPIVCTFAKGRTVFRVVWTEGKAVAWKPPAKAKTVCQVTKVKTCAALRPGKAITVGTSPVRVG